MPWEVTNLGHVLTAAAVWLMSVSCIVNRVSEPLRDHFRRVRKIAKSDC